MAVKWGGRGPGHTSRITFPGEFVGGGEPEAPAATAPVLTLTSAAGTNPPSWSSQYSDVIVGSDYLCCRWRVDGGAWTNETSVLIDSDFVFDYGVDGASYPWPLFSAATFNAGELVEVQEGILRDAVTAWSNTISDTMASGGMVPLTGLLAEGDSITAAVNSSPWNSITEETSPSSYSRLYASERSWITYNNTAVGGAQLGNPGDTSPTNTLYARLAGNLAISGLTHVTVLIGANDQFPSGPNAFLTRVLAYVDEFRSAGIKVAVSTILPRTGVANWNTNRATYNTALRAQVGIGIDAVIDFDTAPIGQDGAESDATLFSDGLHPTRKGHEQLKAVYAATLDAWGGITADDHIAPLLARLSVEPDAARKTLLGDFMVGLKADDVWNSLYALWLPGVFGNSADALLNVKGASNTMTLVGSPTFTADRGFQGNASTAALNLNTTPTATYGSTTSFGAWVNAGTDVASTGYLMGMSMSGNHSSTLQARFTGNVHAGRVNTQVAEATFGASASILGFHALERSSSTLTTAYRNGVANGTSANAESGRVNNPYYVLGRNHAGGTLANPVDYRTPAIFVGRSMGATKQAALYSRLSTLLTAIGAN